MRYSKILLAIVLISMLVFGSTMSAYAETDQIYTLKVFVDAPSIGMGTVSVHDVNGFEKLETGSIDLAYSQDICVEAVANEGYRFVKWERCFNYEGMNFLDKPAHFVMRNLPSDHVYVPKVFLRAVFEPAACIVKVHYKYTDKWIADEVILNGALGATYTSEPKTIAGYELTGTPANATGVFGTTEGHVDYIYRLATTEPQIFNVTGAVSPLASGTINGTGPFAKNTLVTLTAMPITNSHFSFDKWELPAYVTPTSILTNATLTFNMPGQNVEAKAIFKEDFNVMATVKYLNASDQPIKDATQQKLYIGAYTLTPPAIPGYTFGVSTSNASGTITAQSVNFEVIHKYYVPVVVTNTVTNTVTDTVFVTVPATTAPATTEVITTEPVALGVPAIVNFDEFVEDETLAATEAVAEEVMEEEVPLADGLPATGQLSADMFYGIGGLISGLGLWLKRRK